MPDLYVVMEAKVTDTFKSCMAKIHNRIKAEMVVTVADTIEKAIQTSYSDTNKGLKSAMFNSLNTPRQKSSVLAKVTSLKNSVRPYHTGGR